MFVDRLDIAFDDIFAAVLDHILKNTKSNVDDYEFKL